MRFGTANTKVKEISGAENDTGDSRCSFVYVVPSTVASDVPAAVHIALHYVGARVQEVKRSFHTPAASSKVVPR